MIHRVRRSEAGLAGILYYFEDNGLGSDVNENHSYCWFVIFPRISIQSGPFLRKMSRLESCCQKLKMARVRKCTSNGMALKTSRPGFTFSDRSKPMRAGNLAAKRKK